MTHSASTDRAPLEAQATGQPAGDFLRGVGIVFVATMVSNGLLFAVSLVAARWLSTESYGVVASMLSVMVVLTIPSFALQIVVAREVAGASPEQAAAVVRARLRQAVLFGLAATAIACAMAGPVREWLNLASVWPVVLTSAVATPLLAMTVMRGVLQGRRRYGALGASMVTEGGGRFVAAIVALAAGTGATGVTAAPALGALAGAAIALPPLWGLLGLPRAEGRPRVPRTIWATGAYFAGFAVLTNTDLLIVKHSASAHAAGEYAAAAFVGKVVLLLPVAIVTVLIPEVARRREQGRPTVPLLYQALALTGGACALVALVCYLAPGLVTAVTVGDGYEGAEPLLWPYALAMLLFAVASVQALYGLTLGVNAGAWACLALAPLQGVAMWLVRDSHDVLFWSDEPQLAIVWTMVAAGALLWAAAALALRPRAGSPRGRPTAPA